MRINDDDKNERRYNVKWWMIIINDKNKRRDIHEKQKDDVNL